ncbi:MAG: hypothetical protein ACLQAN_06655 [Acidimicrobiales bacterium]
MLDNRINDNDEASRRSLPEAWRGYNRLARVVDPTMVWPVDDEDLTG